MIQFLSLFSGIGAFEKALDNLGIDYNLVNYCEIDKYASKSYAAVHNVSEELNLGDITKVDAKKLPHIDMISYGFPCQDISLAGKQKGLFNDDGTATRSGLFFEALRIIEDTKPKVAIAENVKNLTSKKFKEQFDIVLESLESAGYNNYWQVLNAKDYGVPQNRERVFIVSIRKDIDNGCFKFPEGFELELRLKDLLEAEVDEKYYLSEKMLNGFKEHNKKHEAKGTGFIWKPRELEGVASTLRANAALCPTNNTIATVQFKNGKSVDVEAKENYLQWDTSGKGYNSQQNRAYYQDGLAPTLSCCNTNGDKSQIVLEDKPVLLGGVGEKNFGKQYRQGNRIYDANAVAMCLTAQPVGNTGGNSYLYKTDNLRIRKLTPLECWRLMGFDDEDFYKAEKVNSNTQLYKQAGNSIVVDVLEYLFKQIMEVINVKKVEDKVIVYECNDLINLEALKEKEPELYEDLLADYPAESATYVFKVN